MDKKELNQIRSKLQQILDTTVEVSNQIKTFHRMIGMLNIEAEEEETPLPAGNDTSWPTPDIAQDISMDIKEINFEEIIQGQVAPSVRDFQGRSQQAVSYLDPKLGPTQVDVKQQATIAIKVGLSHGVSLMLTFHLTRGISPHTWSIRLTYTGFTWPMYKIPVPTFKADCQLDLYEKVVEEGHTILPSLEAVLLEGIRKESEELGIQTYTRIEPLSDIFSDTESFHEVKVFEWGLTL